MTFLFEISARAIPESCCIFAMPHSPSGGQSSNDEKAAKTRQLGLRVKQRVPPPFCMAALTEIGCRSGITKRHFALRSKQVLAD
jgi:hypothetical protein